MTLGCKGDLMFCQQYKMKLIAASLGLVASVGAHAALGGLQVQSRLNEPFSATVVVTGDEARALASAKPTVNAPICKPRYRAAATTVPLSICVPMRQLKNR